MRIRRPRIFRALAASFVVLGAATAAAFGFNSAAASEALTDPAFSIVVKTTPQGVEATCEAGCTWKHTSAEYPQGTYRITQEGIAPLTSGK